LAEANDTLYARKIIRELTSKTCYGRGYLKDGLNESAKIITRELKANGAKPFFSTGYYQWFDFNVNTFPGGMRVKVNNKLLRPGIDFIVDPSSTSVKGKYSVQQRDSVTFLATNSPINLTILLKNKLTWGVSTQSLNFCAVELLKKDRKQISSIELNVESNVLTKFINKNICACVNGTNQSDSTIVFTAHYDHLGGLGTKTHFPGANDNASGVSMLLNLVKYYSKNPPKYKTVFIFFAGEEAGLLGSKYFVESKAIDLKTIKFLINLDLLGTGNEGIMVVNGAIHEKQFETLQTINKQKNYVTQIKKRGKAQNSDHYWFTEAGVPCFFIYTMGGISAYHDVHDIEKTLPLTDYVDVFNLLVDFTLTL
jgi:aminopeptidase YwaD